MNFWSNFLSLKIEKFISRKWDNTEQDYWKENSQTLSKPFASAENETASKLKWWLHEGATIGILPLNVSPWECHPPINCWLEKAICLKTSLGVAVRRLVNAYRVIRTQFQINLIDREIDVIEWISNCSEISHWVTGDWALIEQLIKQWLLLFFRETKTDRSRKGTREKNGSRSRFH